MKIIRTKDYQEMSQVAYDVFKAVVDKYDNPIINTTTGASYDGLFENLVAGINQGELDIEKVFMMNLDEYVAPRDQSFTVFTYMHQKFYDVIKKQPKRIELLDGSVSDLESEVIRYKELLATYPRDLQILGLGVNAHLAANEPGTPFEQEFFVADSDQSTINSTMSYNNLTPAEAPSQMLTMGLKEIIAAKEILVTASGLRKAEAVKGMVEGEISPLIPSSILQNHPNVTLIVDQEAASLLRS